MMGISLPGLSRRKGEPERENILLGIHLAYQKVIETLEFSDGFYLRQFRHCASIKLTTRVAFGYRVSCERDKAALRYGAFDEE